MPSCNTADLLPISDAVRVQESELRWLASHHNVTAFEAAHYAERIEHLQAIAVKAAAMTLAQDVPSDRQSAASSRTPMAVVSISASNRRPPIGASG